ncbi:HlyD family secretion protein [Sphingomonas solaris]|uniref:HlyD family secretion protein n=1 Tax=Alterirhizorhabdus solaris TaxID=2529389 RepID=A0A558QVB2_9SPHN|nr:HlyD family secretion protein [Sphingomonas solaris]TVV71065.1 HlyD family secretion protein [Sphingomonas solaris]
MNEMTRLAADTDAATPTEAAPRRRWGRTALMISLPLLLAAVAGWFWLTGGKTVSTDNAQIGAHVVSVAPEVSGRVIEVAVVENQRVKAGDLLFRIDPAPFRIALMQADAAVGNARLQVNQLSGAYQSRAADIGAMAADVGLAEENFRRQSDLLARGFTTRAAYDSARSALASAQAKRAVAVADAQSARAMIGASEAGGHPQVEAALALRAKAELDLRRTEVRAPIAGRVSQSERLNPGTLATAMLGSVSIVGDGDYWVEANFKETQLDRLRIGQPAEVEVDAMPGRRLPAHVTGIGAGTGAQFSLLPPQNATGNWVKVTQRVPVRLKLDRLPDQPLVSGWSAHVTVRVAG